MSPDYRGSVVEMLEFTAGEGAALGATAGAGAFLGATAGADFGTTAGLAAAVIMNDNCSDYIGIVD